ncbi:class I SAM-dependent methyltransferase [Balneolales bacterium ANBcel1]|nr:class I SAM-dependent methyltransferase [Balneolales bacterium ANBcel1]
MNPVPVSDVSRETIEAVYRAFNKNIHVFARLIDYWLSWNKKVNLFSRGVSAADLENHITHSLFLCFIYRSELSSPIIDAGSGGGLPGIPMAVTNSDIRFYLVEKVLKKHLVQKDVLRKFHLNNVVPICSDISSFQLNEPVRIVSKHAFPVGRLLAAVSHLPWCEITMLKGDDYESEISDQMHTLYSFHASRLDISHTFFHNKYLLSIQRNS